MRVVIPLPFGEFEFNLRRTRRSRPLFWYTLLSAVLHCLAVALFGAALIRALLPVMPPKQQPIMVALSSALRIEPRTHPVPAHQPIPHPHAAQPQRPQPQTQAQPQPQQQRQVAYVRHVSARRPELSKPSHIAYAQSRQPTEQEKLAADMRMYERTIAQARAASDPVTGAESSRVTPEAPTRMTINIHGDFGKPQPEGVLYPTKRWVEGAFVYYYVRYTAEYADGQTETGDVPWPIRFPIGDDPFERGLHRMPLPGPLPDYVMPSDVAMMPLVKNCWDHHYAYCPIEREDTR